MLRHRRPIEPIRRRSEPVLQRPAVGQTLCLAGRVKEGDVAFEFRADMYTARALPTATRESKMTMLTSGRAVTF